MSKKVKILLGNAGVVCNTCKLLEQKVRKAVKKFSDQAEFEFEHVNITTPEFQSKFGSLMSPALIFDNVLVLHGKVPKVNLIEAAIAQYLKTKT